VSSDGPVIMASCHCESCDPRQPPSSEHFKVSGFLRDSRLCIRSHSATAALSPPLMSPSVSLESLLQDKDCLPSKGGALSSLLSSLFSLSSFHFSIVCPFPVLPSPSLASLSQLRRPTTPYGVKAVVSQDSPSQGADQCPDSPC